MPGHGPLASSSSSYCASVVWVKLVPHFQANYTIGTSVGFRLRVVAEDACGIDKEVFRFYQKPLNNQGQLLSVFSGVCSWPDMTELPITEPANDTSPPGFRQDEFDIVVDSETMANEIWALIKTQVDELVQTVKDGQDLNAAGAYIAEST